MNIKKLKSLVVSTPIIIFELTGTSLAYSKGFSGSWTNGDTINGGNNGVYYDLSSKKTTISGTARVTNTSQTTEVSERLYIEARRKTTLGSSREHYYTSSTYKSSLNFSTSFTPSTSGKHYLIIRKAQRNIPGTISGTITQ